MAARENAPSNIFLTPKKHCGTNLLEIRKHRLFSLLGGAQSHTICLNGVFQCPVVFTPGGQKVRRTAKRGQNMRFAETGFNLEIDLSRGNIEKVATDPRDTELYLGGLGTNAKIIWDRVPPEVEPFSPDNLLIFGAGLLCGTPATGCNRTIVSTIGLSQPGRCQKPPQLFEGQRWVRCRDAPYPLARCSHATAQSHDASWGRQDLGIGTYVGRGLD
jgi:hypothetical protein